MKVNINIAFAYHEQAKNKIEKETADVLLGLAEFCDDTDLSSNAFLESESPLLWNH